MIDKVKEALKDIPTIKTTISAYGGIDLDEFYKTIDRLNKIPNYDDLMKENNQLQSNWNSLREFVYSLWLDDKGIVLKIRDKINELEGKDKE